MSRTSQPAPPAVAPLQLLTIDPALLRSSDQIREDATPDAQLVESVRTSGILQPPTVVWNDQLAAYYIVFGHRRVGAAIMAGRTEIQVIVRDPESLSGVLVLEEQIVENERREAVSQRELARGWANLEGLFGQTPEEIAAAIAEKPERVRAGIAAVRSEKTHALLATRAALDLEQAAILTEFDEHPQVQAELVQIATSKPREFEAMVRVKRDRLAVEARKVELKAELRAAKVKLAKTDTYGSLKTGIVRIGSLVDVETGKKLTPEGHASCPGHSAYIDGWRVDELEIVYTCTGFKEHGHRFPGREPAQPTEEQLRERAEKEARAVALVANRAARRQWIHDLLPGKINQLPGVYEYMAAALLAPASYYEDHRAPHYVLPLLDAGADEELTNHMASTRMNDLLDSKRVAPFRMLLATALGIHEKNLEHTYDSDARATVRHLTALEKWGYPLTEIDEELLAEARGSLAREAADAATAAVSESGDD